MAEPRPRSGAGGSSAVRSLIERIDAAVAGTRPPDTVPSHFPSVDRLLGGGFRRQDLVVLAGDVGSGKSSLALGIALRSAAGGAPVLFLSGEMDEARLRERALAIQGKAAVDDLRQGRLDEAARAAVGAAAVAQRDLPLRLAPLLDAGFGEVEAALGGSPEASLVIVDSLQLLTPPRYAPRQDERVAIAARWLKSLAVRENVVVLAVAHLADLRRDRPDPRPALDDLGGRGSVKQQADVVLGLFREEMYRPGQGVEGAAELLLLKNRNGPTGFADLFFHHRWLRFEDLLDPD
ncbi:MAG TPA: DnaB-like helicase C-terminal domain-containing protein [Gemmatimonadales bacterium]|nr:DnaB-like helicase C-terminal domain-containing protein [Gemmatimonadales bacterium]